MLVRAYGGRPLVRLAWAWDEKEDVVYITDETCIKKLLSGQDGPLPIGFHRNDVFAFDRHIADGVLEEYECNGHVEWTRLHQWEGFS